MKIALLISLFVSFACLGFAKPRNSVPPISFRPSDTLHIEVIDNLYVSGFGEQDRFRRIKTAIEEVLSDIDFPMAYEIERFGSRRTPPGQPRLDITIMKWGDNGMHELEARFSASLKRDYDRNRLGVFYARDPLPIGSYSRMIRVHDKVMKNAVIKMVYELNSRLPVAGLEELQLDEDLADDLPEGE